MEERFNSFAMKMLRKKLVEPGVSLSILLILLRRTTGQLGKRLAEIMKTAGIDLETDLNCAHLSFGMETLKEKLMEVVLLATLGMRQHAHKEVPLLHSPSLMRTMMLLISVTTHKCGAQTSEVAVLHLLLLFHQFLLQEVLLDGIKKS